MSTTTPYDVELHGHRQGHYEARVAMLTRAVHRLGGRVTDTMDLQGRVIARVHLHESDIGKLRELRCVARLDPMPRPDTHDFHRLGMPINPRDSQLLASIETPAPTIASQQQAEANDIEGAGEADGAEKSKGE